MNGRGRALYDAIASAMVLAVIAYLTRPQIREAIDRRTAEIDAKRREIDAKRREIEERVASERRRLEFGRSIRDDLVMEEFDVIARGDYLGMEP